MTERAALLRELRALAERQSALLVQLEQFDACHAKVAPSNECARLLNADEVADRLGLSKWRVYELGRRGELGAIKLGERQVRFSERALEQWIAARSGVA